MMTVSCSNTKKSKLSSLIQFNTFSHPILSKPYFPPAPLPPPWPRPQTLNLTPTQVRLTFLWSAKWEGVFTVHPTSHWLLLFHLFFLSFSPTAHAAGSAVGENWENKISKWFYRTDAITSDLCTLCLASTQVLALVVSGGNGGFFRDTPRFDDSLGRLTGFSM